MLKRFFEHLEKTPRERVLFFMVLLFLAAHAVYYCLFGIRLYHGPLFNYFELLDPELLRHNLLESCFYLHSQPPLFNLFLGIVLKLFPESPVVAFQVLYTFFGLALYLSLFLLLRRLDVSRPLSLVLSTLFMISPSFVLYENWLFNTFPLALILVGSALLFHDLVDRGGRLTTTAFFVSLLLLCGIMSIFHLSYYCLVAGALVIAVSDRRRMILSAALVPLVLILSLYLKNYLLFDRFAASSWMGMHLWSTTVRSIP
ncbi:hypothetical protein ACFL4G_12960, partial [Thermodesulfobacteriota bacterium]